MIYSIINVHLHLELLLKLFRLLFHFVLFDSTFMVTEERRRYFIIILTFWIINEVIFLFIFSTYLRVVPSSRYNVLN